MWGRMITALLSGSNPATGIPGFVRRKCLLFFASEVLFPRIAAGRCWLVTRILDLSFVDRSVTVVVTLPATVSMAKLTGLSRPVIKDERRRAA